MATLKQAVKAEVLRRLVFKDYEVTLDVSASRDGGTFTVTFEDPAFEERASLRAWMDKQDGDVALSDLLSQMAARDEQVIEKYDYNARKGLPRLNSKSIDLSRDQLAVVINLLSAQDLEYGVRDTIRAEADARF
jgi:hypothetical protein